MTTPSDLNKIRAAFMRQVSAPHVNAFALKLAYLIAYKYMDTKTGTARPSQETLAHDLGNVTDRHVRRMLDILQPLGLVAVPGHGPGRASTYWLDPDKVTTDKRTVESAYNRTVESASARDNRTLDDRNADSGRPKSGLQSPPLLRRRTKKKNQQGGESLSPDVVSSGLKKRKRPTRANTAATAPTDAAFDEFVAAYPKRVALDKARKEFAAVIRKGATPEQLNAAALAYAAAMAGREPRWIKHPANWLADGDWKNPPEQTGAPVIDNETGAPVAVPRRGPKTWDDVIAEVGGDDQGC